MKTIAVIPARLHSSRFPKKILYPIDGKPMVAHVFDQVKKAKSLDDAIVAIDADETAEALKKLKIKYVMTSKDHISGTDRIAGVKEDSSAVLRENQAEDAAAAYDNNLSPMRGKGEYERGTNWLHGKETDDLGRVFDGPDTGYLASAEGGATSVSPINNFLN